MKRISEKKIKSALDMESEMLEKAYYVKENFDDVMDSECDKEEMLSILNQYIDERLADIEMFTTELNRIKSDDAVLIFDEVTSGFRVNIGGIHKTMCVNPDMAVFGKALGNGYAISAVIGIKNVMEASQHSFISSTFWTERLGYVAALETLKKMEKINSTKQLIIRGDEINECWKTKAAKYGIKINITGISPLTHINFEYNNALEIQTLYTQIMLQKGFLLGASVYSTVAYNDDIIQKFNIATDEAFREISNAIESDNITSKLKGRVKHNGFKRLVY